MNEIIEEIDRLNAVSKSLIDEAGFESKEKLSRIIVGLASLNVTLGSEIAEHERQENLLEAAVKTKREQIIKDVVTGKSGEKKTEAYAKALARLETESEQEAWIEARYQARLLNLKRVDTSNLIDSIRSHLSLTKAEAKHSNIGQT